jgi:hypothetical protein
MVSRKHAVAIRANRDQDPAERCNADENEHTYPDERPSRMTPEGRLAPEKACQMGRSYIADLTMAYLTIGNCRLAIGGLPIGLKIADGGLDRRGERLKIADWGGWIGAGDTDPAPVARDQYLGTLPARAYGATNPGREGT